MHDSSLYCPVHLGIWTNLKLGRAADRLGVLPDQLLGHLIRIWHVCLQHHRDGVLLGWTFDDLARAANVPKRKRALFGPVVVDAGFLDKDEDGTLSVHEWHLYTGKGLEEREKERERGERRRLEAKAKREAEEAAREAEEAAKKAAAEAPAEMPESKDVRGLSADVHPVPGPGPGPGPGPLPEFHTHTGAATELHAAEPEPPPRQKPPLRVPGVFEQAERMAEPADFEAFKALKYRGERLDGHVEKRFRYLDGEEGRLHWEEVLRDIWLYWKHEMGVSDTCRRWTRTELPGKAIDQMSKAHRNAKGDAQRDESHAARKQRDVAMTVSREHGSRDGMLAAKAASAQDDERRTDWDAWRKLKDRAEAQGGRMQPFAAWRAAGRPGRSADAPPDESRTNQGGATGASMDVQRTIEGVMASVRGDGAREPRVEVRA